MTSWMTCALRQPDENTVVRWQMRLTLCRATTLAMLVTFAVAWLANAFEGTWAITAPGRALAACGATAALATRIVRGKARRLEQLCQFGMTVNGWGIEWSGLRPDRYRWEQIEHLFIVGAPHRRRLWVVGKGRWIPDPHRGVSTSTLMRALDVEGLLLDIPLDALAHSELQLRQAIRDASTGRFPDMIRPGAGPVTSPVASGDMTTPPPDKENCGGR